MQACNKAAYMIGLRVVFSWECKEFRSRRAEEREPDLQSWRILEGVLVLRSEGAKEM